MNLNFYGTNVPIRFLIEHLENSGTIADFVRANSGVTELMCVEVLDLHEEYSHFSNKANEIGRLQSLINVSNKGELENKIKTESNQLISELSLFLNNIQQSPYYAIFEGQSRNLMLCCEKAAIKPWENCFSVH